MKKKRSGNPVLQGRVSREYKARFDITDEERAYLRGELSALGSGDILVWV